MSSVKAKIETIIKKKKHEDSVGYQMAEKREELPNFLSKELRDAGISKAKFMEVTGATSSDDNLSNLSDDFEIYVNIIADGLDDNIYDPYYQSRLASNHMGLADTMKTLRSGKKINNRLKFVKVVTAISAVISFAWGIRKYTQGSFLATGISFFISADLLRVSYNCFIKQYCSLAINFLGGSAQKLGATVIEIAKSAMGITEPGDDPLLRLKHDLLYEVLVEDTFSKQVYLKALEVFKDLNKK
jgi:hypothetical protein